MSGFYRRTSTRYATALRVNNPRWPLGEVAPRALFSFRVSRFAEVNAWRDLLAGRVDGMPSMKCTRKQHVRTQLCLHALD